MNGHREREHIPTSSGRRLRGERRTATPQAHEPQTLYQISLIDPLPHQRIAVYGHMLTRRLISRVLIVPPAGLVGNWERELRTLFNLPFRTTSMRS